MDALVFDSSSIISISDNCLIRVLEKLSALTRARFIMPESVFEESVSKPLNIKRFELNAIRINDAVKAGWLKIEKTDSKSADLIKKIGEIANNIYFAEKGPIRIIQRGEIEALALIKKLDASALVIDERTTRMLVENPAGLKNFLGLRYRKEIQEHSEMLREFRKFMGNVNIVRSVDLIALSYEKGCFEPELENSRKALEAAMYAVKYSGCAVRGKEIEQHLER